MGQALRQGVVAPMRLQESSAYPKCPSHPEIGFSFTIVLTPQTLGSQPTHHPWLRTSFGLTGSERAQRKLTGLGGTCNIDMTCSKINSAGDLVASAAMNKQ